MSATAPLTTSTTTQTPPPSDRTSHHSQITTAKAPGHWVLASLGKRVLRPGGLAATRALLQGMHITPKDHVIEFAPGLGITAEMILSHHPASYTAIERDTAAVDTLARQVGTRGRIVQASAQKSGQPDACATRLIGEAMLSMHPVAVKREIIAEASRLLAPAGLYGIHELVLRPDNAPDSVRRQLSQSMSKAIHHGVTPLSTREWFALLREQGLEPETVHYIPFRLLNPARLIADEGLASATRFALNLLKNPEARTRVLQMRKTFAQQAHHLSAIIITARKQR